MHLPKDVIKVGVYMYLRTKDHKQIYYRTKHIRKKFRISASEAFKIFDKLLEYGLIEPFRGDLYNLTERGMKYFEEYLNTEEVDVDVSYIRQRLRD